MLSLPPVQLAEEAHSVALPPVQLAEEATPAAWTSTTVLADAAPWEWVLRLTAASASLMVLAVMLPIATWALGEWRVARLRARRKAPAMSRRISPGCPAYVRPQAGWTPSELAQFTGDSEDRNGPILIAVDGRVYNVAIARHLYGPGGEYSIMAGRDATRYLARNSIEAESPERASSALTLAERASLAAWKAVFERKYDVVGVLVSDEAASKAIHLDHLDSRERLESAWNASNGEL